MARRTLHATGAARLIAAARAARVHAHAPYSNFQVGAAVLDDRGRIVSGCNVENASYGLTVCAERNAVAAAVASGARRIVAVAVAAAADPPASPCGACRQVLAEFGGAETPVFLVSASAKKQRALGDSDGGTIETTLGALLPLAFRFIATRAKAREVIEETRRSSRRRR